MGISYSEFIEAQPLQIHFIRQKIKLKFFQFFHASINKFYLAWVGFCFTKPAFAIPPEKHEKIECGCEEEIWEEQQTDELEIKKEGKLLMLAQDFLKGGPRGVRSPPPIFGTVSRSSFLMNAQSIFVSVVIDGTLPS